MQKRYSYLKEATAEIELKARARQVKNRHAQIYQDWDTADAWRYLDQARIDQIIWGPNAQNIERHTIPRTDARSVTDTVISFLSGNNPPKIHVEPANPLHLAELEGGEVQIPGVAIDRE